MPFHTDNFPKEKKDPFDNKAIVVGPGVTVHLRLWAVRASLVAQLVKNPPARRKTWVPSLGWEDPLEKGKAYPLQYSGLENSMDCMAHGVAESQTRLSDFHFTLWAVSRGTDSKTNIPDFPGGPVAETPRSQHRGPRIDPWSGN